MRTCAAAIVLWLALAGAAQAQTGITVNGSATMLPVMHKLVEAYAALHPGATVTVTGGGSGNGIKALIDGFADVAMASRELRPGERELAASHGVEIQARALAVDALCPIVNAANPVNCLTIAQLRGIYAGEITNWSQVGGEDKPIAVISRDTSSGTFEAWRELVMDGGDVFPGAAMLASSGAVLQEVARSRQAIGYEGFCYVAKGVKPVEVEGTTGSLENARTGRYPLARTLWLLTRGQPGPETAAFLDFVFSPQGARIVAAGGASPAEGP